MSTAPSLSEIYRWASTLFLTRRLREAYVTLEPLVAASAAVRLNNAQVSIIPLSCIADAPEALRIKTWCLYITILDSIVRLGSEEGKRIFGRHCWRRIASNVRDGDIWDDVLRIGYGGAEAEMDGEVAINLTILLLNHASSQLHTQQCLERYVSASAAYTLDETSHNERQDVETEVDALSRSSTSNKDKRRLNRIFRSRIKLLELYVLNVLPENGEWNYAQDFIVNNDFLDQEKRDSLLRELKLVEETKKNQAKVGIQRGHYVSAEEDLEARTVVPQVGQQTSAADVGVSKPVDNPPSQNEAGVNPDTGQRVSEQGTAQSSLARHTSKIRGAQTISEQPAQPRRSSRKTPPSSERYRPAIGVLNSWRRLSLMLTELMRSYPSIILRTIFFILALVFALRKTELRSQVRRITHAGWHKIGDTLRMGFSTSYL